MAAFRKTKTSALAVLALILAESDDDENAECKYTMNFFFKFIIAIFMTTFVHFTIQ